ncbi:MAG: M61 family metallopeptidase [Fimbriimonadaceae bacterium]
MFSQFTFAIALQFAGPIDLSVDARQAGRGLYFVTEKFAAQPGTLTLQYPNWMPGAHSPAGSQAGILKFVILADGKPLSWARDLVDMSTVRADVPSNAHDIRVRYTVAGRGGSANISRVSWFQLVWYPPVPSNDVEYRASVELPEGWKLASALPVASTNGRRVTFKPASLTRLVDSPCEIGRYFNEFDVTGNSSVPHYLDVMADSPAGLHPSPDVLDHVRRIHEEAEAITGSHHYRDYHWLLTISDYAPRMGLEHHESSEDGAGMSAFTAGTLDLGDLLSHEYFHSFNGKFRRPIGLCTPDYQKPMKDDLLWVYEGLTQFMGQLLACRAGWWTPEQWREQIALNYDEMNSNRGREWRTLEDTAGGLVSSGGRGGTTWGSARRGEDYYVEATILWLNVDMRIRTLTDGKKSLMDFLHLFHGGPATGPELKPYGFDDIVAALNQVAPYDWAGMLRNRVYQLQPQLSQEAFSLAGWKLVYNSTPNSMDGKVESGPGRARLSSSVGLVVSGVGVIGDVIPDSPADKALLCPGMTILAVNGAKFSLPALIRAVRESPTTKAITLTVNYKESVRAVTVAYAGGLRYPHIVRDESQPDRLSDLLTPLVNR